MVTQTPANIATDLPSATATRRFWMAWLALLLVLLVSLILVILVAALTADPARISPAG